MLTLRRRFDDGLNRFRDGEIALLVDLRQNFTRDPVAILFGFRHLRIEDKGIDAALVNERDRAPLTCPVNLTGQLIPLLHMLTQCLVGIFVAEPFSDVLTDESGQAVNRDDAQIAELRVVEDLQSVIGKRQQRLPAVFNDFFNDPVLEFLCIGSISRQHQRIDAAFVDDEHFALDALHALIRCRERDECALLVRRVHMFSDCIIRASVAESVGNVLADEVRCVVQDTDTDITELRVREHLEGVVHENHPFRESEM